LEQFFVKVELYFEITLMIAIMKAMNLMTMTNSAKSQQKSTPNYTKWTNLGLQAEDSEIKSRS